MLCTNSAKTQLRNFNIPTKYLNVVLVRLVNQLDVGFVFLILTTEKMYMHVNTLASCYPTLVKAGDWFTRPLGSISRMGAHADNGSI